MEPMPIFISQFNAAPPPTLYTENYSVVALQRNFDLCTVSPEKELQGLSPNFHIHVSVSDLIVSLQRKEQGHQGPLHS